MIAQQNCGQNVLLPDFKLHLNVIFNCFSFNSMSFEGCRSWGEFYSGVTHKVDHYTLSLCDVKIGNYCTF